MWYGTDTLYTLLNTCGCTSDIIKQQPRTLTNQSLSKIIFIQPNTKLYCSSIQDTMLQKHITNKRESIEVNTHVSYHFTACFAKNPRAIKRTFNMCLSNQVKVNFWCAGNTVLFTRKKLTLSLHRGLGESQSRE